MNGEKNFVIKIIDFSHKKLFDEAIGEEAMVFIRKVSHVGLGTAFSTLLTFPVTILAGRILGSDEYGRFALVQSVGMVFATFMTLGLDTAMVKYSSEVGEYDGQASIISTTYILISLLICLALGFSFAFHPQLTNAFSIAQEEFLLAILFAFLFALLNLSLNTLRALDRMRTFSLIQPLFAGMLFIGFITFLLLDVLSYELALYPYFLAYGITSATVIVLIGRYLSHDYHKEWAGTLLKYSAFTAIGALSFMAQANVDRLLINKYLSVSSVGVYFAYLMASTTVAEYLFRIFNTVFFPMASKQRDKQKVFKKLNRVMPFVFGGGFLFVFFSEYVILLLYGDDYPINPLWMALFAISSICSSIGSVYSWLLNSAGIQGVKINALASIILVALIIGLYLCLIPTLGIIGAVISMIIAKSIATAVNLALSSKYLPGNA
jgi:O-antigen/teichoic acid export membrane protein